MDSLKKFKESTQTFGQEVIKLKAKLSGVTHQANKLMKKNAKVKSEVATLHEPMDKVKEEAMRSSKRPNPISMRWRVITGMALRTSTSKLSFCS